MHIEYPEFTHAARPHIQDSLNTIISRWMLSPFIQDSPAIDISPLMNHFLKAYSQTIASFPEYRVGWSLERHVTIVNETADILTLAFFENSYTGGAHPNSTLHYSNIDLFTGRELTMLSILADGGKRRLTALADSIFRRNRMLTKKADLQEAGYWFEDNTFRLNQNFGLRKDGLVLYFNAYDIASYAAGPTEILIRYDLLTGIVDLSRRQ
ncbi:MAG: DUF3298 domain-containing protein [Bacteroidetes bacterium]|nr:DUF3298 domain-containing protein [Bacteroidota bacterium]